ncbi:acyl-CoA N-acyltransferase [Aspergillus leporis]|uniref:Acyl-CoA N-acyltransferase n=1 Tax=Aspergillus leporis TaxID=41062 RepID=A0A5N5WTY8_9EURO|nr:acyl-CoA N-acyltransferase [Aspergillus leporis]
MTSNNLQSYQTLAGLNAFTRPLTAADVKSCVVVESAFPEHERCSEEKFEYRLNQTPELCLGLFVNTNNNEKLIAHVVANRSCDTTVREGSMHMPDDWQSHASSDPVLVDGEVIGNDPRGASVAVHSVVVLPEYQGTGVGKCLVKRYIEYIRTAGIPAERIILLCHDYLIRFYESAGFENRGLSQCRYAGETWYDMVLNL